MQGFECGIVFIRGHNCNNQKRKGKTAKTTQSNFVLQNCKSFAWLQQNIGGGKINTQRARADGESDNEAKAVWKRDSELA